MRKALLCSVTALGLAAWGLLVAGAARATDTYVDFEFDRTAWEAAVSGFEVEPFDNDVARADTIVFDSGIESVASDPISVPNLPNHQVDGTAGRFQGTLRTANATAWGYLTFVWTFPQPITAFGADFYSIGGSRQVSVLGTFDAGLEAFDLRALFVADGGVDQGFFGLTSSEPFTSITLIALGSIDSNDAFEIDNVVYELPEPAGAGAAALLSLVLLRGLRSRRRRA